ncbi:MAG: uroporphyrinogen-III C-methyltransferase [Pyrobaculum sp.]|uniref:uroporphyrinogen-III C-methyltransferase n=1 Tax=unclassified Pyrobaculum TaxID=2643434 RepID=UPI0021D84F0D|nr:uroporphyrinogen-III C-methyltransferase [Pyrobaculum sp. 3827-6]MCU7787710.1 uroporphyrinogen-III C-methyltransferase [Pyrobaculum sp. 3827-6]
MPIYVVGAGPGDPSLLTVKAVELLRQADVVAYGDLVPEEIVTLYAPSAKRVKIGHRKEEHDTIVEQLIEEARDRNVVILKNGDPSIFGRGVQICKKAENRGVSCQIVPGISAFTAAAALYKIELTDGVSLRHIALFSFPHFNSEILNKVAADTAVIFMMGERLDMVKTAVIQNCEKNVEIYICYAITIGGGCIKIVNVDELDKFQGVRPLLIIIRKCKHT